MTSNKLFTVAEAAPLIATVTKEHPLEVAKRISSHVSGNRGAITIYNYAGWPIEEQNWPWPHDLFRFSSKVKNQPYYFFHELPYSGYQFNLIELLSFLGLNSASKEQVLNSAFCLNSEDTHPTVSAAQAANASATKHQNVKKWTPELLAEVAAFRAVHGTKKTAEKYGVSTTLIRRKLPQKKITAHWFPT